MAAPPHLSPVVGHIGQKHGASSSAKNVVASTTTTSTKANMFTADERLAMDTRKRPLTSSNSPTGPAGRAQNHLTAIGNVAGRTAVGLRGDGGGGGDDDQLDNLDQHPAVESDCDEAVAAAAAESWLQGPASNGSSHVLQV